MPIFIKVESKTVSGRLFHAATFLFLTLGGLTMIYPFLLMVSGSFRSEMDENDLDLVPGYFHQEEALYQKVLETKYQQAVVQLNEAHLTRDFAFRFVTAPETYSAQAADDLLAFFAEAEMPAHWQVLGGVAGSLTTPENLRDLRRRLAVKYRGDLERFSREVGTAVANWQQVTFASPLWLSQRYDPDDNALTQTYLEMLEDSPYEERQLVSLSGNFLTNVGFPKFGGVGEMNAGLGLAMDEVGDFRLSATVPPVEQARYRQEWVNYVLEDLNLSFVLVDGVAAVDYQTHLRTVYQGSIADLNQVWETAYSDFAEILLPDGGWLTGAIRNDYGNFLEAIGPDHWRLIGPEYAWWAWLRERYDGVEALSQAHGRSYAAMEDAWLPFADVELRYALENRWSLRVTFAARNFVNVFDAVFVSGRIFYNTVVFCSISVLLAILINPLAAYAMSRFQLPGTFKILLLMMAVMAFPPMVTTIPTFIMLQNMGLMNTFAGLILPGIANGYLIYLLKGFFDSLPRELYEAAQIDGASEFRMFFNITMALSKPILAVVGLSAFNSAYSAFLFALIIAPEPDMWLLSVWLYQYRDTVSLGGVFASVLVASIPPILVFLFAQNIILRGIVVPVEK